MRTLTLLYKCEYKTMFGASEEEEEEEEDDMMKKKKKSTCNASNPSIIHVRGSMRST